MRYVIGLIVCWALFFGASSADVAADVVKLQMRGSALTLEGKLVDFDGKVYVVDVPGYGNLRFEVDKFECVAGKCPKPDHPIAGAQPGGASGSKFGIHGSNTIGAQLMPALVAAYAEATGGSVTRKVGSVPEEVEIAVQDAGAQKIADIDLRSHGSGTSFPSLANGRAEIGMSSRPIKDKEVALLGSAGLPDLRGPGLEHVVALDGLLVIVSPQNKLTSVSMGQLADIFSGKIADWSALGLPAGKINLYARDDKSGTYDTFKSLVLKPRKVKISPGAKRFESNADLSDEVAADPSGIGFTGFAYKRNAKTVAISTDCGINYAPSVFNVKTEEYPLARRLFLYTTGKWQSDHARKLLEFSLSDVAQDTISEVGFIDQTEEYLPFAAQGDRIAFGVGVPAKDFDRELMRLLTKNLQAAERMSVTFRFRPKSKKLDNKARRDVLRLTSILTSGDLDGKSVFLIGFADSKGPFDANQAISLQRAISVKNELVKSGLPQDIAANLKTVGYGELLPIGCNDQARGREANRRVEVWVR